MTRSKVHRSAFRNEIKTLLALGVPLRKIGREYQIGLSSIHRAKSHLSAAERDLLVSATIANAALTQG